MSDIASSLLSSLFLLALSSLKITLSSLLFIGCSIASADLGVILGISTSTLAGFVTLTATLGIFSKLPGAKGTLFPAAFSIVSTWLLLLVTLYVVGTPFTFTVNVSPACRSPLGRDTVADVTLTLPSEFASSLLSLPFLSLSSSIST